MSIQVPPSTGQGILKGQEISSASKPSILTTYGQNAGESSSITSSSPAETSCFSSLYNTIVNFLKSIWNFIWCCCPAESETSSTDNTSPTGVLETSSDSRQAPATFRDQARLNYLREQQVLSGMQREVVMDAWRDMLHTDLMNTSAMASSSRPASSSSRSGEPRSRTSQAQMTPKSNGTPYTVEEPDDTPPASSTSNPRSAEDTFDKTFIRFLINKQYGDALLLTASLPPPKREIYQKRIQIRQQTDFAEDTIKDGRIATAILCINLVEKGSSKDDLLVKLFNKLTSAQAEELITTIVDLLDQFDDDWKRGDSLRKLTKAFKLWDSFDENSNRVELAEKLYEEKLYGAAAKLIGPVPKDNWARESLAEKLAKHVI